MVLTRLLPFLLLLMLVPRTIPAQDLPDVAIGIVFDGDWEGNAAVEARFKKEILVLTEGEFAVRFPEHGRRNGGWKLADIYRHTDALLADPDIDLVLTMGVIASHYASRLGPLPKPVVAPFVIDPVLQDLPRRDGTSGVRNLSFIAIPSTVERDIGAFLEIVDFRHLTILVNGLFASAIDGLPEKLAALATDVAAREDLTVDVVAVNTLDDALKALTAAEVDAVYLAPLIHLPAADYQRLVTTMIERDLPSFAMLGPGEVEAGILASMNPELFPRLSRRVALNVQRILLGEDAGSIPYAFTPGHQLTINMATAREIGVYPPWEVVTEAVMINQTRSEVPRTLDLPRAVQEGMAANLDLLASEQAVAAGRHAIAEARGNLLPQVSLSATALQIDADRAGQLQPERTLTGTATLTQLIYNDDAWTNLTVQKRLQASLEASGEVTRLDIAQAVASAYLNLLNAKTLERIQKDNLRLSRNNLELARVRESVGYSGRADVYRWESQIATNRREVISANATRNVVEMQVNRLLNRPLEEGFQTLETGLDTEQRDLLPSRRRMVRYMRNQWAFRTFRAFLVEEGLAAAPELVQIDAAIAAQERLAANTTRSLLLPSVALQAELSERFLKEGAGSEPLMVDPASPLAGFASAFDTGDETNWSVALNASFTLFNGGSKYALRRRVHETLARLRTDRAALAEKVEQRIRSAAHRAGASYAGINQARHAAEAARRNLELVIDSYSNGVVDITKLLDAQNAALVTDQAAAGALFEFLIDLMELERSIGRFTLTMNAAEQDEFFERADRFFEAAGVTVE